ncbi:MAG: hypothetical protein KTV72_02230 [Wolbachia endosymbiont of Melophagus ovinus]|nr:hypothetical protein [Wolbachia endosymbiont of Melophagus ovinus]
MSKEIVDALKAKVRESEYTNLRSTEETLDSGYKTYKDLDIDTGIGIDSNSEYKFAHDFVINGKVITNDFIKDLYSEHKNLILQNKNGKENYRLFLKAVFTKMFWHADARIPNNSIMEELITYYNRSGYMSSISFQDLLCPFELRMYSFESLVSSYKEKICMDCDDSNCLKFSFNASDGVYGNNQNLVCNLHTSVKFKLKCESKNVTYEEGKVSLTIPRKLKNYKVDDKNLFDIIIEYFQRACEKLGFKFEAKIEHSLGKPLKVIDEPGVVQGLNSGVNNQI